MNTKAGILTTFPFHILYHTEIKRSPQQQNWRYQLHRAANDTTFVVGDVKGPYVRPTQDSQKSTFCHRFFYVLSDKTCYQKQMPGDHGQNPRFKMASTKKCRKVSDRNFCNANSNYHRKKKFTSKQFWGVANTIRPVSNCLFLIKGLKTKMAANFGQNIVRGTKSTYMPFFEML